MSFLSKIFGDPLAIEFGQILLEYFESEEFPMDLLRDEKLNYLYFRFRLEKVFADKTLSESDWFDRLDDIFALYNEWAGKDNETPE